MPLTQEQLDVIADRIADLNPQQRTRRWSSISLCILDAVWSIGAHYDNVVTPLVVKFARSQGVSSAVVPVDELPKDDPIPASSLARFTDDALLSLTNCQLTSTRGGVTKAHASIAYAQVLVDSGVESLSDAIEALGDKARLASIDAELARVPGDGQHGIRRGYLWMLVGDDNRIKPDRMILGWFRSLGVPSDPASAEDYIRAAAPIVSARLQRPVTPWEIDHAIWNYARSS